jgi:hypothetical protein
MTVAAGRALSQLRQVRARYGAAAEAEKRALLAALREARFARTRELVALHDDLLFLIAFAGSAGTRARARELLEGFSARWRRVPASVRTAAEKSGIAGTVARPLVAWSIAQWLARSESVELDWSAIEDAEAFDALVGRLVAPAEQDAFASGEYGTRQWVELARPAGVPALRWLLKGGAALPASKGFAEAWDAAEVPVAWKLQDSRRATTHARLPVPPVYRAGMRRPTAPTDAAIVEPLASIDVLPRSKATRVIDLARSALTARCREVHAMNHANADEVHLADLGEGVQLALIGVRPAQRLLLEANYGYLLMSNGVPIGYGGVTPLFRQANTGINIFDPFRGSEAAFLWVQMLRAFRTLFGTRRFIVNGYQFGAGNSEAIASGAYWFYWRLGFRPTTTDNVALAAAETERLRRDPRRRTPAAVLRRLAQGDLILDLPDWQDDDAFDEALLARLGAVVARRIAALPVNSHAAGERHLVRETAAALGVGAAATHRRRLGFDRLAPLAALTEPLQWPATEREQLAQWLLAKGDAAEHAFASLAAGQSRFFHALREVARAEESRAP